MNRKRSYKGAFVVSFIFNIILLMMLSVIGFSSIRKTDTVSDTDVIEPPAVQEVSFTDAEIVEIDVPSEEDQMGDGEDLVEVTTTTPAPVVTTSATADSTTTTTAKKTTAGTTKRTTAKTTRATNAPAPATTTAAPATTTQKPATTTTKGSGDNDSEMDWSGFH